MIESCFNVGIWATGLALLMNQGQSPLLSNVGLSVLAYKATAMFIPRVGPSFIKRGFSGKDMNKVEKYVIPETMGAVSALVYFMCMIIFIPVLFYKYLVPNHNPNLPSDGSVAEVAKSQFPHDLLGAYLSALLSILSVSLLGILDDLFDIRWRHKFFLPAIAAIPLLVVYYVDYGVTYVSVPSIVRPFLKRSLINLGFLYYFYMAAVAIFCPNSINIIAGVNGVEAGQSLVLALVIACNDLFYVLSPKNKDALRAHLLSLYLVLPLIGVTAGLLKYNWWPSRVFVGDTFCYFAGMVMAVVGILGHFSKTLMLFFIPQIFNFALSVPQLFGLVECPRHRLPKLNVKTGLLENSYTEFSLNEHPLPKKTLLTISIFEKLRLIRVEYDPSTGRPLRCTNFTIINFVLYHLGPMREDHLTICIMGLQLLTGIFGLIIRHFVAPLVYPEDNI
ncbi:UDP-N-acetylglucosamine--dolichyl-phosphate N-acetylglucosaminephosphotransferase [Schizosaccharomyces pombe]|uniref:UDP-N-acetylglucosamine--dolichyl-phosphate N-acetylglucosaminephosphotransferase n=1 Tax=Schizosaccharomyces pombe (strain 972 / ATCC 24843) TaxID=284812 RepID=GPT_SCHPO|nr:UDP-N-acetylglucosamine--dolichyl-phosphate N-acetylglucosaminephosphotransferase [Schizosaccharomyces pombe]P42881.1 RecName: Full=UDP-N-acetylglucosamine--dolichyl-phosphate N-acetylglucosaminephosphotransferase; AltName: Full=GlcNAc-1-P transferase; Short=G1PT; Short=GPT; AltName: Full=N-acetylglucosamine-1-phosphate transferase [Schizosaccharomyces pombe 972h-]AAA92799.1 UDP-N-acetylglucosamine: dolichyl phosphate N-acetylglucosamine-1-phosphate transferase [Schizosaccharomyces pombe]CAA2|eukprot:NP_596244.1 UDP-N-acetylglucosamine--dolichyl-phosphate N-acetylglucosaminephosphotransferase [Schizosaccharomyces pombe]